MIEYLLFHLTLDGTDLNSKVRADGVHFYPFFFITQCNYATNNTRNHVILRIFDDFPELVHHVPCGIIEIHSQPKFFDHAKNSLQHVILTIACLIFGQEIAQLELEEVKLFLVDVRNLKELLFIDPPAIKLESTNPQFPHTYPSRSSLISVESHASQVVISVSYFKDTSSSLTLINLLVAISHTSLQRLSLVFFHGKILGHNLI